VCSTLRTWCFPERLPRIGQTGISALFKTEQILVSRVSKIGGERLRVSDSLPFGRTALVILDMAFTSPLTRGETQSSQAGMRIGEHAFA
jgi:hypothetical protein